MINELNIQTCTHGSPNGSECAECSKVRAESMDLVRGYIIIAKKMLMEHSDVLKSIDKFKRNGSITNDDAINLTRELNLALGKTPEQIREKSLDLVRGYIIVTKNGEMNRRETLREINRFKKNGSITNDDAINLTRELNLALGKS